MDTKIASTDYHEINFPQGGDTSQKQIIFFIGYTTNRWRTSTTRFVALWPMRFADVSKFSLQVADRPLLFTFKIEPTCKLTAVLNETGILPGLEKKTGSIKFCTGRKNGSHTGLVTEGLTRIQP